MSFKSVQKKIASQGHSMESAGAILANASRHASAAAKRANPKLKRVKGKMHEGGIIPEDGTYEMEKGETVLPAHESAEEHAERLDRPGVARETVSSTPNTGNVMEAQPTVDGGHDSGVGHWEGDGASVKFVKA